MSQIERLAVLTIAVALISSVAALRVKAADFPTGNARCVERWHGEMECRDRITNVLVSICRKQSDGTWVCRKP